MKNENRKSLNESSIYILLAIYYKPLSGYEITRKVMEITNGRLEIRTGIMYPTLKILLEQEYIQLVNIKNPERNKKVYTITERGKKVIEWETIKLNEMLADIHLAVEGGKYNE